MVSRVTGAFLLLAVWTAPGVRAEDDRYINDLRKHAKKGDVAAQYKLGLAYADAYRVKRDYALAVEWLGKAGQQGHAKAQLFLGKMYYTGLSVEKSFGQAADWLEKAAENGDPEAQSLTGNLYNNGEGRPQDFGRAVYWYRAAAEQGDAKAQYNLGVLYHNGEGVEQDVVQALKWISLAAANPPVEYPKEYGWAREDLEKLLQPQEREQARSLIEQWRPKSWAQVREEGAGAVVAEKAP
jgi:TPR repeat protein